MKWATNGSCIKCVKCYHGIESTTADVAQSQNQLGVEALDLTGEGSGKIDNINEDSAEDVCQGLRVLTLRRCPGTKSLSKLGSNPNNVLR